MKTKKVNRDEVRTDYIVIKATADEKNTIKKYADEMGLTMSGFVRFVTKKYITDIKRVKNERD